MSLLLGVGISLGISPSVWAGEKIRESKPCDRWLILGIESITFSDPERRLLCGDPTNPSWKNVPDNQAVLFMRTFLQDYGYFSPKFDIQPSRIEVTLGNPTRVTSLRTEGEPRNLPIDKLRNIVGVRLTPKLLDATKDRLRRLLEERGYPCSDIKMEADPDTGEMLAHLQSGLPLKIIKVDEDKVPGMWPGMMRRYWAFDIGSPYNGDFVNLTSRRITDQGIVQSTYFTPTCTEEGAILRQQVVAGPPRIVTLGTGVDTEQFLIGRANWTNSRMGSTGSSVSLTANASSKVQQFIAQGSWYFHTDPSRSYLKPGLDIKHENEQYFENLVTRFSFGPAATYDSQNLAFDLSIAPTLNWTRTYRGPGPGDTEFMSLSATFHTKDHYFEFYRDRPRRGFSLTLDGDFTQRGWLSPVTAQAVRSSLESLWNIGNFDPPFLVFGFRAGLYTTFTDEQVSSQALPSQFRNFLGGSGDLRGFGRQELPGPNGGLSAVYGGVEFRIADTLPWGLQPFVFGDFGMLGSRTLQLDSPVFWDPGFGLRWQAPFGVIRTTLSHGFVSGPQLGYGDQIRHWQFYFSFGEEF